MPAKLYTMLQWILCGVASDLQKTCDQATDDVADKAFILAQQIMYSVKSDHPVHYEPKSASQDMTNCHHKEFPLQVGTDILAGVR